MDEKTSFDISQVIDRIDRACAPEARAMEVEKRRATLYAQSEQENAKLGGETLTALPEEINHRYVVAKHELATARRRAYTKEFAEHILPWMESDAEEIETLYRQLAERVDRHIELHQRIDSIAGRCGCDGPPKLFSEDYKALTGGHLALWRARATELLARARPAPAAQQKPKPKSIGDLVRAALQAV